MILEMVSLDKEQIVLHRLFGQIRSCRFVPCRAVTAGRKAEQQKQAYHKAGTSKGMSPPYLQKMYIALLSFLFYYFSQWVDAD